MLVPKTRTVVTLEDLVHNYVRAHEAAFDETPEAIDAAILYGKLCMECGHPGPKQAVWCHNIGNVRGRSRAGRYCLLTGAYEVVDADKIPHGWYEVPNTFGASVPAGQVCVLPLDTSKQEFRAYEDLDEAFLEYLEVLGRKFGAALTELAKTNSSPELFITALKATGYFTGDVTAYRTTVASIARQYLPKVEVLMKTSATHEHVQMLEYFASPKSQPLWEEVEGEHTPLHLREPSHIVLDFHLPDLTKGSNS